MTRSPRNQTETTSRQHDASPGRHPALIVLGSADGIQPQVADPIYRIGATLLIGRDTRDADPGDGKAWRPSDRLVSSQHATIIRGPRGLERSLPREHAGRRTGRPEQWLGERVQAPRAQRRRLRAERPRLEGTQAPQT